MTSSIRQEKSIAPLAPSRSFGLTLVTVFVPFAAGYYLSYLYRTVNALLAGRLVRELDLDASQLGLLTSSYLFMAMVCQIPLGIALDRYGPRRVQGLCLLIAASGAALFSLATDLPSLLIGRALIGVGVASALVAGLKSIVIWFDKSRLEMLNGVLVACGAAGALTASVPIEWALTAITWRELFVWLAAITAVVAMLVFIVVPAQPADSALPAPGPAIGIKDVVSDARFWRIAPLSASIVGSAWALQGLWAAPWLSDVAGYTQSDIVGCLFFMACAFGCGALGLGIALAKLRRFGVGPEQAYMAVAAMVVGAELTMAMGLPVPPLLPWLLVAVSGASTVLTYSIMPTLFPKAVAARANSLVNVLHFGTAFAIQSGVGQILALWPRDAGGHYPAIAYGTALAGLAGVQWLALIWFVRPWQRTAVAPWRTAMRRWPMSLIGVGWRLGAVAGVATVAAFSLMPRLGESRAVAIQPQSLDDPAMRLQRRLGALEARLVARDVRVVEQAAMLATLHGRIDAHEREAAAVRPQLVALRAEVDRLQDGTLRSIAPQTPGRPGAVVTGTATSVGSVHVCDQAVAGRSDVLVLPFDGARDTLTAAQQRALDDVIDRTATCPDLAILIKGYSDNRGAAKARAAVALQRAQWTARYLEAHGVSRRSITTVGLAARDPVASNATEDGRARNRRVEVVVKQRG